MVLKELKEVAGKFFMRILEIDRYDAAYWCVHLCFDMPCVASQQDFQGRKNKRECYTSQDWTRRIAGVDLENVERGDGIAGLLMQCLIRFRTR